MNNNICSNFDGGNDIPIEHVFSIGNKDTPVCHRYSFFGKKEKARLIMRILDWTSCPFDYFYLPVYEKEGKLFTQCCGFNTSDVVNGKPFSAFYNDIKELTSFDDSVFGVSDDFVQVSPTFACECAVAHVIAIVEDMDNRIFADENGQYDTTRLVRNEISDNRMQDEKLALALKAALFSFNEQNNRKNAEIFNYYFKNHTLSEKFFGLGYDLDLYANNQLMNGDDILSKCTEICDKYANDGCLDIEIPLLNSLDITMLVNDLGLDCSSYTRIGNSLNVLINDDEKIVNVD